MSPKWILSAKHCLFDIDDPIEAVFVIMGGNDRQYKINQQVRSIKNVIRMKYLTLPDIALGELDRSFKLSNSVDIVRIPKSQEYNSGQIFVGVGWGKISNTCYSDVLQFARFKIYSTTECFKDVGVWSQFAFCSKGIDADSSILSGDSGGPAIIYNEQNQAILIGINVATKRNSNADVLWQLSTKIQPYVAWIKQHINTY